MCEDLRASLQAERARTHTANVSLQRERERASELASEMAILTQRSSKDTSISRQQFETLQ